MEQALDPVAFGIFSWSLSDTYQIEVLESEVFAVHYYRYFLDSAV